METKKECPICKNPISQENLIPIYTKEQNSSNTNRFKIPNRPKGQREPFRPNENSNQNTGPQINFMGGFGFFPFFGFNLSFGGNNNQNNNFTQPNNNFRQNPAQNNIRMALQHLVTLLIMLYFYNLSI
jgi:hypothetical protein